MGDALKTGAILDNGAVVIHHTPRNDGWAGLVLANWSGAYVVWRTPRALDGSHGEAEMGQYFGGDFFRASQVYAEKVARDAREQAAA